MSVIACSHPLRHDKGHHALPLDSCEPAWRVAFVGRDTQALPMKFANEADATLAARALTAAGIDSASAALSVLDTQGYGALEKIMCEALRW